MATSWPVPELHHKAAHDWAALPAFVSAAYERGEVLFANHPTRIEVKTKNGWRTVGVTGFVTVDAQGVLGVDGPFDPQLPGTFHLSDGLFFRKVERRTGGAGNQQPDTRGIWWDVEITKAQYDRDTKVWTVIAQRLVHESSWCSVVSSMGAHGEDTLTYGLAQALHRSGVS